ncbi:Do family serine endopeptidase, partial [Kingella kingae]
IKGMTEIKVALNDKREYPAKLIGSDEKSDIALLKIEASDLPVAKIGSPSELKSGEWVAAIGAPFGFDNSVTAGIVSAKNRTLPNENYMPFIQTDVAINPGNSGGPLFNLKGQVVGINSQIYSRSGGFMGISFAIPIDVAMNVVDQLKSTGKVERGQLGVVIQELSYDLAKSFGLDKPAGALVAKVSPNSPAEKAGLEVGDIIRSVNGEAVRSSSDLPMTISAIRPGDEVKLGIWRKGETLEIIAKLISQSEQQSAQIEPEESYRSDRVTAFTFPAAGLTISVRTNNSDEPELVISRVQGIAAKLGLRRGDVIVRVGEQAVRSQEEFDAAVRQAGNQIPLLINRAGDAFFTVLNVE